MVSDDVSSESDSLHEFSIISNLYINCTNRYFESRIGTILNVPDYALHVVMPGQCHKPRLTNIAANDLTHICQSYKY